MTAPSGASEVNDGSERLAAAEDAGATPRPISAESQLRWARQQRMIASQAMEVAQVPSGLDGDVVEQGRGISASVWRFAAGSAALAFAAAVLVWSTSGSPLMLEPLLLPVEVKSSTEQAPVAPIILAGLADVVSDTAGTEQTAVGGSLAYIPESAAPALPLPAASDPVIAATRSEDAVRIASAVEAPFGTVPRAEMPYLPDEMAVSLVHKAVLFMPEAEPLARYVPRYDYGRSEATQAAKELFALLTGAPAESSPGSAAADGFSGEPKIYLYQGLGASPARVQTILRELSSSGFERVFVVKISGRIGRTNIRFFHQGDAAIAGDVTQSVIPLVDGPQFTEPQDFSANSERPERGTIEIWLSDRA